MSGNEQLTTTPKKESNSAVVTSKCSCPDCDSIDCFIARSTNMQCSCVKCKNSKTCFFYSNKVNVDEKSSDINIALDPNPSSLVNAKKKIKNDHIENEVSHDLNNMKSDSVFEKQTKYSDTTGRKSELHDEYEKDERHFTNVHSARVKFSRTTLNPAIADLSAQIMNVPYKELKNSLSVNNAHKGQMTKYDIITRIKEAYKACSCKVCECVIGKSQTRNELCKCKPCDCNDCTTTLSKFQSANGGAHFLPIDGCPCIRCTRSQCTGIVQKYNEPQICDCKPCDCIKCSDSFNEICNCHPCQCVECNAMSVHLPTILSVAPVVDNAQHNMCQCSPCDCIECGYSHGISSNLMHEMSTGINIRSFCHCEACVNEACEPGGSGSCKCQYRNRIIMKPVEKKFHDDDIRTMSSKKHSWNHNNKQFTSKNHNGTITMFTTLPDPYSGKYDSIKEYSNCDSYYKSLVCNYNENYIDSMKSSRLFKVPVFPHLKSETSKCSSLEYQLHFDDTTDNENSCKIKIFNCLNCENLTKNDICKKYDSVKLSSKLSSEGICRNRYDPCVLCRKLKQIQGDRYRETDMENGYERYLNTSYSSEDSYPVKRAKLLTPSILNGIECENMDSIIDSTSSNLDNSLKMSELPLRKSLTNIKNQSHKDLLIHDTFQKSDSEIRVEQPENYDSCLSSNVSSGSRISDINKSNIKKDVNTDLKKLKISFGDLYKNIVDNKQTVYDGIKIENKMQHNNVFNGKSIINDFLYNYNITRLSKSTTNYNKHIDLRKPQYNEENIQANTIDDNIYNQDIPNNMHVDRYNMLSDAYNNTATNQSQGIILSDPQFHLNSERHEEVKHIIQDAFKNKAYSVIDGEQAVNTYLKTNTNLLNLHVNYEKAQKTLNEAKMYSMHLLEILDKYEKANTAFQSTSQKLKASRDLLFDESIKFTLGPLTDGILKNNENKEPNIQILDEPKDYTLKRLANQMNINTTTRTCQLEPIKLEREDDLRLPTKVIGIPDIKSQKAISMGLSKNLKRQYIHLAQNKIEPDMRNNSATMTSHANYTYLNSHQKNRAKVTCHKNYYNKLLRRARILSKENSSPPNTRTIAKHISSQTENNFKNSINKEDSLSRNTSITYNKELIEDSDENDKFNLASTPSIKGIVSTNCFKIEESGKAKDLDIVEITKEMKYQYDLNPVIKDLINSKRTIVTTIVREGRVKYTETSEGTDSRISLIQSTKSSCDALKVNFLGLKRVSDHTVLVRWNSPRDTTDIQGYELQVDGRAVQKILSPTRNIAVVTCLPHCDKLLLTVKTITSVMAGHYPSVTVIYHPRKKSYLKCI